MRFASKLRKYSKTLVVIIVMLLVNWRVLVELTQTRIQIEATSKLHNRQLNKTPWVWDFVDFKADVVESFQHYWQKNDKNHAITAKAGDNPQLSLNFSGEQINAFWHDSLLIEANQNLHGQLVLQVKTTLYDDKFYYSKPWQLDGNLVQLDLFSPFTMREKNSTVTKVEYLKDITHISSLVLIFQNPKSDISIKKISLKYRKKVKYQKFTIDCAAKIANNKTISKKVLANFYLNEKCILPSQYMWIKSVLQHNYPESLLAIGSKKINNSSRFLHKVNHDYSSSMPIKLGLYLLMLINILLVFVLLYFNKKPKSTTQSTKWYQSLTLVFIKKSIKNAIKPYRFLLAYSAILLPTFAVVLFMMLLKEPQWLQFNGIVSYFIWALIQQFFVVYILADKLFYRQTDNRLLSALLAAMIFAVLHMPSVSLMFLTFIAAGFWSYAWLLFKQIIPLALSHSVLALMLYAVALPQFLYSAKVLHWFWE